MELEDLPKEYVRQTRLSPITHIHHILHAFILLTRICHPDEWNENNASSKDK